MKKIDFSAVSAAFTSSESAQDGVLVSDWTALVPESMQPAFKVMAVVLFFAVVLVLILAAILLILKIVEAVSARKSRKTVREIQQRDAERKNRGGGDSQE